MNILALDTAGKTAAVAVMQQDILRYETASNTGLTHSETLLPMVDSMLVNSGHTLSEVDVVAVAAGPGSFTGLRIGVAAAKGLAWVEDKDCAPCSTLESMAWPLAHMEGAVIVCAMDARRKQVYNARFLASGGTLTRLSEDRAIGLEELAAEVKKSGNPQIIVGDGASLCYNAFEQCGVQAVLMPPHLIYQTAWGVARAGLELARQDKLVPAGQMAPRYHRLSQAERERLERMAQANQI